jgi:hypothetical protein
MPTGLIWMQHFEKQSTAHLIKLYNALTIVLKDPMLGKEYGEGEGMDTLKYFIERELNARKTRKPK